MPEKLRIVSLSIDRLSFRECLDTVIGWGKERKPSYVCFANVHMIIEAYKSASFLADVDRASLVVADGKPVTAACWSLYRKKQERISGMDFMPAVMAAAEKAGLGIFLYGSSPEVLDRLAAEIARRYPALRVGGMISPPFRPLSPEETDAHLESINRSGARLLLVSLGCPKQERWMAANHQKIGAVCLGVGGAFPVMAGLQKRAPRWMQNSGLEWFYRLVLEPRRMFPRYLKTNSLFIYLMGVERLKQKRKGSFTIKTK